MLSQSKLLKGAFCLICCLLAAPSIAQQSSLREPQKRDSVKEAGYLLQAGKPNQAKQILEETLRRDPHLVPAWIMLARANYQLGLDDESRRSYEQALKLDPTAYSALYDLGILELRRGRFEQAAQYLETYRRGRSEDLHVLLPLAHCLFQLGRVSEGQQRIEEALRADPNTPEWNLEAGKILLAHGRYEEAAKPLFRALTLRPKLDEARLSLAFAESRMHHPTKVLDLLRDHAVQVSPLYVNLVGSSLCEVDRCGEAIPLLQQALQQYPEEKDLYLNLAAAYEGTSQAAGAMDVLERAHTRWPKDSEIRFKLARKLFLKRDAVGAVNLLTAETETELSREELGLLTECNVAMGQFDDARKYAELALAQFGPLESSLLALANVLQLQTKDPEVIALLEPHQAEFSSSSRYLFTLGLSYYRNGKYSQARALLERATAMDPSLAQGQFVLGSCFSSLGNPKDALPHYKAALILEPENFLYQFQVGLVLSILGQKDVAEGYLRRSIELNGSHAPARYHLAEIYFESGRDDLARQELEKAIEINPGFDSSYYLLSRVYASLGRREDSLAAMNRFKKIKEQAREGARELKRANLTETKP